MMLSIALTYLRRGWSIFPLIPRDKRPALPWQPYQHRLPTEAELKTWYEQNPTAGIAIITGAISGIVVLDMDPRHQGGNTMLAWLDKGWRLPNGPQVKTGGEGVHFYLTHPGKETPTVPALAPGIDFKADGAYVVGPPSMHPSGNRYQWLPDASPEDYPLPQLPLWLLELIAQKRMSSIPHPLKLPPVIPVGERNSTLFRLAASMRRVGMSEAGLLAVLKAENNRCIPPLTDDELKTIAGSAGRYTPNQPPPHKLLPGSVPMK